MTSETDDEGGRIFFSSTGRSLAEDDQVCLLSVGIDIGSSTSHLVFSRIVLERLDSRYVVTEREAFYASDILLTPYADDETIDAAALGAFIRKEYADAKVDPDEIDTGALILTGVAARRRNARAIGDLFAREAGKLIAVSAGDSMETVMAAHGSGAIARSLRDPVTVMNVDIGGGTAKIAVCAEGRIVGLTTLDVGARLICLAPDGTVLRIEEAARRFIRALGLDVTEGMPLTPDAGRVLAARMAEGLFDAMRGGAPAVDGVSLLRLAPLGDHGPIHQVSFSGGVSEFISGAESKTFDDLGPVLAAAILARMDGFGASLEPALEGIRATVVGASQYTVQLSGSTIYVAPLDALPLRNVPVIAPRLPLDGAEIDAAAVAAGVAAELARLDLADGESPVALFVIWAGSATYRRLDAFCRGVAAGLAPVLARGHALVLAGAGDVGGLIGVHLRAEMNVASPIVSLDGLELAAFDYIDIGAMLDSAGAVPVVIKSLVFPAAPVSPPR